MMELKRLPVACGAEVTGVDGSAPIGLELGQQLRDWLVEHGLLIVRGQTLDKKAQVEFSKVFGELAIHPLAHQIDPEQPELLILDSHGRDGTMEPPEPEQVAASIDWHTDLAYVTTPNYAGLLHPVILPPEGGKTGFVDRQATYDALSPAMKARIEGLTVVQSWRHSMETISKNPAFRSDEGAKVMNLDLFPDLGYPLVFEHPFNGRKVLNVTAMWSSAIVELPGEEGEKLIAELVAHSLQPQFVYWHEYTPGDVVIWDNYRMMHAASGTKGKYRRRVYRTTIDGKVQLGGLPLDAAEVAAAQERIAALRKEKVGI